MIFDIKNEFCQSHGYSCFAIWPRWVFILKWICVTWGLELSDPISHHFLCISVEHFHIISNTKFNFYFKKYFEVQYQQLVGWGSFLQKSLLRPFYHLWTQRWWKETVSIPISVCWSDHRSSLRTRSMHMVKGWPLTNDACCKITIFM